MAKIRLQKARWGLLRSPASLDPKETDVIVFTLTEMQRAHISSATPGGDGTG